MPIPLKQGDGAYPVYLVDANGNVYTASGGGGGGGDATAANQATQITAEQAILAKLLAAPATEAKQDTGNASLASIDAGIPAALGQTTMAASMPVVLASNQSAIPADTELPAAAALSDTQANPTTPVIGALLQLWDGSTNWVRAMFDHATNKALRVSNYGKSSAAGDTAVLLTPAGRTIIAGAGAVTDGMSATGVVGATDGGTTLFGASSSVYNGATLDRQRANNAVSALASAARTATANADVVTYNAKTFRVILNITVAPNTASTLTLAIRVKDSISGNYITILTGAAETGSVDTGAVPVTKTYSVGAGLVATANVSAAEALARTMNVIVTHSNADSWTYSVSVELGV